MVIIGLVNGSEEKFNEKGFLFMIVFYFKYCFNFVFM